MPSRAQIEWDKASACLHNSDSTAQADAELICQSSGHGTAPHGPG
jgi:hypothetical protein